MEQEMWGQARGSLGSVGLLLLGGRHLKNMNFGPEAGSLLSQAYCPPPPSPCPGRDGRPFHGSGSMLGSAQAFPPSYTSPVPMRSLCHRALALWAASSTGLMDGQLTSGDCQMQKEKAVLPTDGNSHRNLRAGPEHLCQLCLDLPFR